MPESFDYPRLIRQAEAAYERSQTEWAKNYWLGVITKLAQNVNKH